MNSIEKKIKSIHQKDSRDKVNPDLDEELKFLMGIILDFNNDPKIIRQATGCLIDIGGSESQNIIPKIEISLKDLNSLNKRTIIWLLGRVGKDKYVNRSIDIVKNLIHDKDFSVVRKAVQVLGMLGNKENIPDLIPFLNNSDGPTRRAAIQSIYKIDKDLLEEFDCVVPFLIIDSDSENLKDKLFSISLLGKLAKRSSQRQKIISILIEKLESLYRKFPSIPPEDWRILAAVVSPLRFLGKKEPRCIEALERFVPILTICLKENSTNAIGSKSINSQVIICLDIYDLIESTFLIPILKTILEGGNTPLVKINSLRVLALISTLESKGIVMDEIKTYIDHPDQIMRRHVDKILSIIDTPESKELSKKVRLTTYYGTEN
jgi:hypothetical protein